MFDELLSIIIQYMGESKKPVGISELEENTGFDKNELISAVNNLKNIGLVKNIDKMQAGMNMIELVTNLKGIHIARSAQAGVDVSFLDKYFKVDKKEKKTALEIANKSDKIKNLDVKLRKPLIQKRAYLQNSRNDDTYDNLILLLEGASTNLYDYLEELSKKDPYLKLILSMHQQAEVSLHNYVENLK